MRCGSSAGDPMTPVQSSHSYRDLCARLRDVLLTATEQRGERGYWVERDGSRELGWVLYERAVMHEAVNAERAALGFQPVPAEDVERAERAAIGLSDYTEQWVWGCAQLVLRED